MEFDVDLLVIGGGIQGMALMQELSADYSTMLVGSSLTNSETMHFHGYFSSGWNAANPEAAKVYHRAARHWNSLLTEIDSSYRNPTFHVALPPAAVDGLRGNWDQAKIRYREEPFPRPFDLSRLPTHQTVSFPEDVIFNAKPVIDHLHSSLPNTAIEGNVEGFQVTDGKIMKVSIVTADGDSIEISPQFVLSSCGAGNASILNRLDVSDSEVDRCQVVRPMHMVLARGKSIPQISGFLMNLVVMAHPLGDDETLWILTYNPESPQFETGSFEIKHDLPIEPDIVCTTLSRLAAVLPDFENASEEWQWDVYVGWKTDAPGDDTNALLNLEHAQPFDVRSFGLKNFLAVWPNHWCLATPAAESAATVIRNNVDPIHPPIRWAEPLTTENNVSMKWVGPDRQWRSWSEFAHTYGFRP